MFFPRNTAKVLMQPGAVVGETSGLYACMTVNTSSLGGIRAKSPRPQVVKRKVFRPQLVGKRRAF
jgi:hypothetical protein